MADTQVYEVDLHGKKLSRIDGLDKFKLLRVLDLSCNHLTKIEGLHSNKDLRELKLYGNQLEVVEGLNKLTELCSLLLQHNKIRKIGDGLQALRKLRLLRLDHNQLETVTPSELAPCAGHLTHLDLSYNRLKSVSCVSSLRNIEELKLSSNQLQEVPDLTHCSKLEELDISRNPLKRSSLCRLANTRVKVLHMESVHLDDITHLPKLRSLEELHVAANVLTSVEGVAALFPKLELLDLRHNCLKTSLAVEPLKELGVLSELLLEGNALCSRNQDYRNEVKRHLPNLQLLDGVSLVVAMTTHVVGTPLMRPLTSSSVGPSVRQMEHQLLQAETHLENCSSEIRAAFEVVQAKGDLELDNIATPPLSSRIASCRPVSRAGSNVDCGCHQGAISQPP